jgi:hypothetical protein
MKHKSNHQRKETNQLILMKPTISFLAKQNLSAQINAKKHYAISKTPFKWNYTLQNHWAMDKAAAKQANPKIVLTSLLFWG